MYESSHFFGQCHLRFTLMRFGLHLLSQCFNRRFIQECEVLQVLDDITVIRVRPELVEFIRCRFLRIKPDRAACCFAELRTIRLQHQRNRQAKRYGFRTFFFTDQIKPARNVAPLIRTTNLQLHVLVLIEVQEIN
ncbi:hypothetical protein D3C76_1279200 [compost metagenome]